MGYIGGDTFLHISSSYANMRDRIIACFKGNESLTHSSGTKYKLKVE